MLTGHTGLTSGKLLTDLTEMKQGDLFYLTVLDQTLAYKVDQIKVVLPEETEALRPVAGEDHCTIVTCTPYGVNSHRLLVRGIRTAYVPEEKDKIKAVNNTQVDRKVLLAAIITASVMLGMILVRLILLRRKGKAEE
ncbi:hypothetical protein NRIC_06040 [Enterococcus florum]|uniref:Sortase n=1 Tax=Enterococcus florum TaxID=2480627 RepID=A0A4P5PGT9_9ENTE|nr:hypothetical protein NRIC_06040 [Enterococcus florum]